MLVALDVSRQIRPSPIDAEPTKRRLGEQEIRALPLEAVLQQPMREDDVDAGHLAAAADQLSEEAARLMTRLNGPNRLVDKSNKRLGD